LQRWILNFAFVYWAEWWYENHPLYDYPANRLYDASINSSTIFSMTALIAAERESPLSDSSNTRRLISLRADPPGNTTAKI
jgi:hypothetical protein